jgi:outer membrane lipoprotein-sorting protein
MQVWIDRKNWLPIRLTAVSVQGDFYDLRWNNLRLNEKIPDTVFQIEIPSHFHQNIHPLEPEDENS